MSSRDRPAPFPPSLAIPTLPSAGVTHARPLLSCELETKSGSHSYIDGSLPMGHLPAHEIFKSKITPVYYPVLAF